MLSTSAQVRCDEPVSAEAPAANGLLEQLRNGGTLMRPGRLLSSIVCRMVFVCLVMGCYKHARMHVSTEVHIHPTIYTRSPVQKHFYVCKCRVKQNSTNCDIISWPLRMRHLSDHSKSAAFCCSHCCRCSAACRSSWLTFSCASIVSHSCVV